MTPVIKTEVLNISRQPYSLLVGSKRVAKLRAGEKIELPYDIWSMTSALGKKSLETDIRKELIKVTTYVSTENSIIVISCDDKCKATTQIQPPEVKSEEKTEAASKLSVAKTATEEKAQKAVNPKNLELVSTEAHVRVANKSSSVMRSVMGADTVSLDEQESLNQNRTGFTPVEQVTSTSMFSRIAQNISTEGSNLIKAAGEITANLGEEVTADDLIAAAAEISPEELTKAIAEEVNIPSEMLVNTEDAATFQMLVDVVTLKDIDTLIKKLKERYPNVSFTKAALKKCETLKDIRDKYNLDDIALNLFLKQN